jgi:hypothetical protein
MTAVDYGMDDGPRADGRPKYFSVPEADRALVLIRRVVTDIVRYYARLGDLQETLESAAACGARSQSDSAREELLRTVEKLQTCLEELEDIGVELKDWSRGIVDFPCIVDGQEVYLCWEHGQDQVSFWHEVQDGYAGKQPITTLPRERQYAMGRQ